MNDRGNDSANAGLAYSGISAEIRQRAANVRLLVCDVDGVLTDGKIHFHSANAGDAPGESKSFSILDGFGVKLLQETGVSVALITGRRSDVVIRRAKEMNIVHVVQGAEDKKRAWSGLLNELKMSADASAYIGDDWPDLPVIRACGLGIAVANAPAVIRRQARYVTQASGGAGAVREVCELIMDAQGTLQPRFEAYF